MEIITIILNILLIIISFYLLFIYLKSKTFRKYPCYNIIILSFIILIDNILRIIITTNLPKAIKYIQAFLLTFLDKLLLTTITSQAFLFYLGVVKTKFYYDHERHIFFSTLIITISIDILITILYFCIIQDITNYKDNNNNNYEGNKYYYIEGDNLKKIADTIFDTIFLFFNTIFICRLILYIHQKKKQANLGLIDDLDYGHHYMKILLMFFFNSALFIESYLIIYNKIKIENIDIIYLTTCLFVDLSYTINKTTIKETLKIFCLSIYNKKYGRNSNRNESLFIMELGDDKDYACND